MTETPQEATERALELGGWSVLVRDEEIAEIRWHGVRLLRAIRPVVRDADWNTIDSHLDDVTLEQGPDTLLLQVTMVFVDDCVFLGGLQYAARLSLLLTADGELAVTFEGVAASDFEANRIGLVVLHPLQDAGRQVTVVHSDGSREAGTWPERISPHQPFVDVAGFSWSRQGVTAEVSLVGDVFETEDQRNWTDASFKTYSTPLSKPFPVQVRRGDSVRQAVRLSVRGLPAEPATATPAASDDTIRIGAPTGALLPGLGVAITQDTDPESLIQLGADLESLLVEVLDDTELTPILAAARTAGVCLDVRLVTDDPRQVQRRLHELTDAPVLRIGVFSATDHVTGAQTWQALRGGLGTTLTTTVAGSRAHFTELNRRVDDLPADAAGIVFSLTPQMHARELPHLLDSLQAQPPVADNAVRLADGRPVIVGPITLRRRFNAVATSLDAPIEPPDPLQHHDFTAAWTLASIAALARPGVTALSYYEADGPCGVIDEWGEPSPTAELLRAVAPFAGDELLEVQTPAGIAALAVASATGTQLWLANLSDEPRRLGPPAGEAPLPPWGIRHTVLAPSDHSPAQENDR